MLKNLARLYSAELEGINAKIIEIEADINVGLHAFNIVGLADKAVNEAKERVNSALKNAGIKPPNRENRKITINLAPADVKKTGSHYDLAIALGYLLATKQIKPFDSHDKIFLGELALDGRLRPINGALNIAERAAESGFKYIFLPQQNAEEAAAIHAITIFPIEHLRDVIHVLEGRGTIEPQLFEPRALKRSMAPDLSEIKGQENAKRALLIAASGGHNMLMIGPPGVGKSFLAQALAGILPDLGMSEAIEVTKIWSAAGLNAGALIFDRPFRAPHQTTSVMALVGGGQDPKPGEISLAHRGVLFLDELPEFQRSTLEALRRPMELGVVHIARAKQSLIFPARFAFIGAMNPCPCGYYGDPEKECVCGAYDIIRYQKRVSGPLFDRIDIQIKLGRVKIEELRSKNTRGSESIVTRAKVDRARTVQLSDPSRKGKINAELTSREIQEVVRLEPAAEEFLGSLERSRLSPRSYYRLLKVARTIADLEEKEKTSAEHLAEAFSYRLKEEQ